MKFWQTLTKYLNTASWITSIAAWTKVPQVVMLNNIIKVLEAVLNVAKGQLLKINQRHSDEVIRNTNTTEDNIEEERNKPLPEQDNDRIREEARRGRNGNN